MNGNDMLTFQATANDTEEQGLHHWRFVSPRSEWLDEAGAHWLQGRPKERTAGGTIPENGLQSLHIEGSHIVYHQLTREAKKSRDIAVFREARPAAVAVSKLRVVSLILKISQIDTTGARSWIFEELLTVWQQFGLIELHGFSHPSKRSRPYNQTLPSIELVCEKGDKLEATHPNWNTDGSRGQVELRVRGQAREALEAYQLLASLAAVKAFEEVEEFSEFQCGYACGQAYGSSAQVRHLARRGTFMKPVPVPILCKIFPKLVKAEVLVIPSWLF